MKIILHFILYISCLNSICAQDTWQPMNTNDFNHNAFLNASNTHIVVSKDNLPYVVYQDATADNKCTVQKFNGVSWELVGIQGFSSGNVDNTSIALDHNNVPYVAYKNSGNKITVQKFNGTSWTQVGIEGFSIGTVDFISIAVDNNNVPYVVYSGRRTIDYKNKLTVQKHNGTSWELVGSARFSEGNSDTYNSAIAIDNNNVPYVAYENSGDSGVEFKSIVQKFNGTSWETVGSSGFSQGVADDISIALDGNNVPYVAYLDVANSYGSTVQKFNGTSWEVIGKAGFSAGQVTKTVIAIDKNNLPYVAYRDLANSSKITIQKFNGTTWSPIGRSGFSVGSVDNVSIALDSNNTPYVVYKDNGNKNETVVRKFNGNFWEEIGPKGISEQGINIDYISSAISPKNITYVVYPDPKNLYKCTVQKYNGKNWEIVGKAGFSIGKVKLTSIAIDNNNTPYVAYEDDSFSYNGKSTVQKFNGTSWELVGTAGFSKELAGNICLAIDHNNTPYVAYTYYINTGLPDAMVQKFNGKNWVPVGTLGYSAGVFSNSYVTNIAIDNNNIPYVSYFNDNLEGTGSIKKFENNSWETVGSGRNFPLLATIAIDSNNVIYILHASSIYSKWNTVQKFNGISWELVGTVGFCRGEEKSIAIDHNNIPYIFYSDHINNSGKSTVLKFNGIEWEPLGSVEFSQKPIDIPSIIIDNNNVPIIIYRSNNNDYDANSSIYSKYFAAEKTLSVKTPIISSQKLIIYPNPIQNTFSVLGEESIIKLEIFDLIGKSVYKSFTPKETYNIEGLPKGIYIVKLKTDKETCTMKIIKE
jgi:hypothetical protein